MRPARALLVFLGVVLVGGALLAPWLYALAQLAAESIAALEPLARQPFHRYVHRSWLALALLGLVPMLRACGVRSSREIGLVHPRGQWQRWGAGFLLGLVSLAGVAAIALAAGARGWVTDITAAELRRHLAAAILAALGVSVLEEIVFRGVLFGLLRKAHRWPTALVISSVFYALVHFFQRTEQAGPVGWASGLELLPGMLRGLGEVHAILPGLVTLTLAGVSLGLAYQRTGNLYFSFGLHAGWIFWLKSYGLLTRPLRSGNEWFWGTNQLTDGGLALMLLALVLVVVMRLPPAETSATQSS